MRIIWPTEGKWRYGTVDFGWYEFIQLEIFNFKKGIRYPASTMEDYDRDQWEAGIKDRISKRFWRHIGAM